MLFVDLILIKINDKGIKFYVCMYTCICVLYTAIPNNSQAELVTELMYVAASENVQACG